jgi:NAD(P)-dependent dehydrogenase (short-subunit alcohol dehydrogenase family)
MRVVLITGATGGLGPAVVRAFASAGDCVVPGARQAGRSQSLIAELGLGPERALALPVDVTQAASVAAWVEAARARWGRVNVLVNLAGGYQPGRPVHEMDEADLDRMFDLNARSAFLACRAVVPLMLAQGAGKIVNVASRPALAAGRRSTAYAISKAAVLRLTEALSAEVRDRNINVNAVIPSTIDTPDNRSAQPNADPARWVRPEDLASVIVFLASDLARAIHGAGIPVYGLS